MAATPPHTALACLKILIEHCLEDEETQSACDRLDQISRVIAVSAEERYVGYFQSTFTPFLKHHFDLEKGLRLRRHRRRSGSA